MRHFSVALFFVCLSLHQVEYFVQVVNQAKQKISLCFTHFNVISHPLVDWQFKNSSGKSLELEPRLPEISSGIGQIYTVTRTMILGSEYLKGDIKK
jgi:hypothetical protein